jgi:alkanesulfonate monooxygenase SsuD/methylene tetrahydromethanopterin reductase-like flavin-dependent oxidoreductase (luciferase family)
MQAAISVWASALASATKRVKIILLGYPLPVVDNPVRIAEELGLVDMLSGGRLVSGFVRGGGTEQFATNANPAYNRARFEEAHDLIIKLWTEPGPFRWEGDHFNLRVVNPWTTPLQKPHPRIWIPGVSSNETIIWAAEHRYPYIGLLTSPRVQQRINELYGETAKEVGYEAGPQHRGQILRVHVADTEEQAERNAREFTRMQGEFSGLAHPVWSSPPGYLAAARRRGFVERANGRTAAPSSLSGATKGLSTREQAFQDQVDQMMITYGTPDQVVKRLKGILEQTRPGILGLWGNDGKVSHKDSMRCIELTGKEVLPALREYAKELDLKSPWEADEPVSLATTPKEQLHPQPAEASS